MSKADQSAVSRQGRVDRHFDSTAQYWEDVYVAEGVEASIYRERHGLVLEWIDELELPSAPATLEVGCGAGLLTTELAARGHTVTAIDSSSAMVELARDRVAGANVGESVEVRVEDAHALPFATASFDLLVAVGVVSWLHAPVDALRELARVVKPDGAAILTADNGVRLAYLLDPRFNPLLSPVRRVLRKLLRRGEAVPHRYFSPRSFERLLAAVGLERQQAATVGFGPFTLLGRPFVPDALGQRLNRRLQALADRGSRPLSRLGTHYVVLARRTAGTGS